MIDDAQNWTVIDHVCRHCMGRILERGNDLRCADCGARATQVHLPRLVPSQPLCCCGLKEPVGSTVKQNFRCVPNPHKSAENRAEIVVSFGGLPASAEGAPA